MADLGTVTIETKTYQTVDLYEKKRVIDEVTDQIAEMEKVKDEQKIKDWDIDNLDFKREQLASLQAELDELLALKK